MINKVIRFSVTFLLIIWSIMACGVYADEGESRNDLVVAKRVSTTPSIDGVLDEKDWDVTNKISRKIVGDISTDTWFGVLYDQEFLYVAFKVMDAKLYADSDRIHEDDSVEIYIDIKNMRSGEYNMESIEHITISHDAKRTKFNYGTKINEVKSAAKQIDGGYTLEVAVPVKAFGHSFDELIKNGIGFGVGSNFDEDGGNREGQLLWGADRYSYQNTTNFGQLQFLADTNDVNASTVKKNEEEKQEDTNILEEKMKESVILFVEKATAYVKGVPRQIDPDNSDVMPMIKEDRTLLPVRFIAESFDAVVGWDEPTATITITTDNKIIKMVLGNKIISINGAESELDVPAQTINDRTFIPLRAMVEALGKQLMWDDRGLIIISDTEKLFDLNIEAEKSMINKIVELFK